MRNGRGVYQFPDKTENDLTVKSIYMGYWENNIKHGVGSYIWRKYPKDQEEKYENCQITAFVGWFYKDNYDVGMFYEERVNDLTVYYGTFEGNKKHDKEGFFYHNSIEETYVVVCDIDDDFVFEGIKFVFSHDEESNKNNFIDYIEFKYNTETHENLREGSDIEKMPNDIKEKYKKAQDFIDLLFKEEDFDIIYKAAIDGEVSHKGIDSIEIFNQKFVSSLKNYCSEGSIKLDNKIRDKFPKEGKFKYLKDI